MEKVVCFIQNFDVLKISEDALHRAKYIMLDSIGEMSITAKKDIYSETFWSGVKLVENEMDEGNSYAKGHPACHFLPALLRIARENKFTFEAVLEAFIVGYEVGARFGEIIKLKNSIHPHGNWGILGGAASFAKLFKWDAKKIEQAILVAAQFSYPTLWHSVLEGHRARNAIIGMNNVNLLLLPEIIEKDVTASEHTLKILFSEVLGDAIAIENWNDDLETHYITKAYFKFYDSCRFCHGPIDAVLEALKLVQIASENDVVAIQIETYESAARLNNQKPSNSFAGKFSIPYAVAKIMCDHLFKSFYAEDVYRLAEKVFVKSSKEINALLPDIRATKLTLQLKDQEIVVEKHGATGEETILELQEAIEEKFRNQYKNDYSIDKINSWIHQLIYKNHLPYKALVKETNYELGC